MVAFVITQLQLRHLPSPPLVRPSACRDPLRANGAQSRRARPLSPHLHLLFPPCRRLYVSIFVLKIVRPQLQEVDAPAGLRVLLHRARVLFVHGPLRGLQTIINLFSRHCWPDTFAVCVCACGDYAVHWMKCVQSLVWKEDQDRVETGDARS